MSCQKEDYLKIKRAGQILCGQMCACKIGGNMRLKLNVG